ncbi:MAG: Tfp pilus assembly protein FimT/FimU [Chthoniobacteraceae bacterium]
MNKSYPSNVAPKAMAGKIGFRKSAFSLLELLTVISIISIMGVTVGPSLASISDARGTSGAIDTLSGAIENARQSAMQMNTWVWVGIADTSSAAEPQLSVVEVASRDGSTDLSQSNLMVLGKPVHVSRVTPLTAAETDGSTQVLGSTQGDFGFTLPLATPAGRTNVEFTSKMVIGFSPRGEAMTSQSSVPAWIKVAFSSNRNAKDTVALLVSGPSGQVVVTR